MRLALVITSSYAENAVVPNREAFQDTARLFAERIAIDNAGFEIQVLQATRDLPEALEELLRAHGGKIESLLVHFAGYVAVKADRGPALLLDGSRLRAFPLSRLRAALEDGAQQALVIVDAIAVVDAEQSSSMVAAIVSEALVSPDGAVTALVGVEEEWAPERRGVYRLTDLFTLSLGHLAKKPRSGVLSSTAVYQSMQGELLSFASIPGLEHRAGSYEFVLLEGPAIANVPGASISNERTTEPVAVFLPQPFPNVVSAPSETPSTLPAAEPGDSSYEPVAVHDDEPVVPAHPADEGPLAPPAALYDIPIVRTADGRSPTIADTPDARAQGQREWISEAAYFPSAPPPRVSPVAPVPTLHPQATRPGFAERSTQKDIDESTPLDADETPAPPRSRTSQPSFSPNDSTGAESGTAVIALYEELLQSLDASEDPRRAEVHAKLGDALRDTQRRAEALFAYERALGIDPFQEQAFDGACALYREDGDYTGLVSTIRRRLQATFDVDEKLSLLDLVVHVWLHEARDVTRAIEALEERLALVPDDVDCMERLIEAHDRQADVFGRLESRERLARHANATRELRAALWVEAATLCHDELDDLARTFIQLEYAVDLGVRLRESLDATEALLGGRERWLEVIELYERALQLVTEPDLAVAIAWRLVQLVLEQFAQDALKSTSIAALVRLSPLNRTLAEAVGALLRARTVGPETVEFVQQLRAADPRNVEQLHFLFSLSREVQPDVAVNVASVLLAEGAAGEEEAEYASCVVTDALPNPQRPLETTDYETLIFPVDFDRELALTLGKLDQTLLSADVFGLRSAPQLPKETPLFDPVTSTVTLARSFLWTSQLLSVAVPELAVVADAATALKLIPQESRPRVIVDKRLTSGLSLPELAYLAARHGALLLPGFAIRDHSADPRTLGSALYVLTAVANGRGRGLKTLGEYEQKLGKRLLSQLDKNDALMAEVQGFFGNDEPTQAECEDRAYHWLKAVDQIRLRVALLACGSPATALKINREFPLDGPFAPEEQLDVLAAFAGSAEHCELRVRLGLVRLESA